jgi:hypothetical protein
MLRNLGLILLGCLFSTLASAEKWEWLGSENGIDIYIDKTSINPKGKYIEAWFRWDYRVKNTLPVYPRKAFLSAKSLEYFDCDAGSRANAQLVFYSGQSGSGETVSSFLQSPTQEQFTRVMPESIAEASLEYVCNRDQ